MTIAAFGESIAVFGLAKGTEHGVLKDARGTKGTSSRRGLFILVRRFSQCTLYGLTRSTFITSQDLDFKLGIEDWSRAPKREKEERLLELRAERLGARETKAGSSRPAMR